MTRIRPNTLLFTCLVLALTFAAPPPPPASQFSLISTVHAATINVDSTCTIIQAINSAKNNSTPSGSSCEAGSGADTINISGTHTLTAHLPQITGRITIVGSNNATIDANNQYFLIRNTGILTIRNVTLTGGRGSSGSAVDMFNNSVTLENSVVRNNTATGPSAAFDIIGGTTVTIKNSVIHNNTTSHSTHANGAAIKITDGTLTIENSTFYDNSLTTTSSTRTEGIHVSGGSATLTHVTIARHHGGLRRTGGSLHLRNSLITGDGTDCAGTLATNAGNLIEDNSCSPKVSGSPMLGSLSGGVFPLLTGSPAIDAAVTTHCTSADQRGVARPIGTACDIGAYEYQPPPPKRETEARAEEEPPSIPPTPMPPTYTGEGFFGQTGIRVSATHGLRSGVQFKRIGAANIGLPSVINNGFLDAVDIFGYVNQGVEVCFPQSGALIFLDAATSPRTVLPWPAHIIDGMTCGRVDRPGTLVLVPLNSPLAGPVSTPQPAPSIPGQPSSSGQITLTDCFVTTTHILNLRSAPNGDIIGRVNYNATLSARAVQGPWFQITVDGLSGWISADFATTRGNCA